jgi:hypothetical protein
MKKYYSSGKTQSLHNKIATFAQYPTETISEAFERFNEYTQEVPYHKFPKDDHRRIGGRIHHRAYTDRIFHFIQEGRGQ